MNRARNPPPCALSFGCPILSDRWTSAEFDEEDEEGEYGDDHERHGGGPLNIGKAFLIPRARTSLYDGDIFAPSLLEARDMVKLEPFCFIA